MMELCDKVQLIQQEIQRLLEKKGRLIVAIDGRCGSGKSTLAAALQEQYGYPVVHMDDFFLRSEQRTAERLATPGEYHNYNKKKVINQSITFIHHLVHNYHHYLQNN